MSDLPNAPRVNFPSLLPLDEIERRLKQVFPEGLPARNYVTREMAARTVYVMLYIGALPGGEPLTPRHVYRMTHEQAAATGEDARMETLLAARRQRYQPAGRRWYADNTREPIRDETLRYGLVEYGAVLVDRDVATTANEGRYVLQPSFAALFDPALRGDALELAITEWRDRNLNPGALARVRLLRQSLAQAKEKVGVQLPSGEARLMSAGMSSVITKAVVEQFLPRFLRLPAVIWISESSRHVVERDEAMARQLGLDISTLGILPDMIAADLDPGLRSPLILFAEVVATDGPVTEGRQRLLMDLAAAGGHAPSNVAFLTAFASRSDPAFKKLSEVLAVGSLTWAANEPETVMWIARQDTHRPLLLSDLVGAR